MAKSIGVVVTSEIFKSRKYNLDYLILMGIPGRFCDDQDLAKVLDNYADKIKIIQNQNDPVNDTTVIKQLVEKHAINNYIEKEASNHKYEYRNDLLDLIKQFNE
jgi:hypothetical protein